MKKLNSITILYNLAEDINLEADTDTEKSAKEIGEQLSKKYHVEYLGINLQQLDNIKTIKTDLVFNMIEWSGLNTDSAIKANLILEQMHIPFTGSTSYGIEKSDKKDEMKKIFDKYQIPTPIWMVFKTGHEEISDSFVYPAILKPLGEHCGIGIAQESVAHNEKELRSKTLMMIEKFKQPVLAEEFILGRELHVTVLEKNGLPWVLPPTEIVFNTEEGYLPILTYAGKWEETSEEYKKSRAQLAILEDELLAKIESIASQCYKVMDGRDYPRLDLRIRGNDVYVLEINNNPGIDFTDESGFGVSGKAAGFTYEGILSHIVENAYLRFAKQSYDSITA